LFSNDNEKIQLLVTLSDTAMKQISEKYTGKPLMVWPYTPKPPCCSFGGGCKCECCKCECCQKCCEQCKTDVHTDIAYFTEIWFGRQDATSSCPSWCIPLNALLRCYDIAYTMNSGYSMEEVVTCPNLCINDFNKCRPTHNLAIRFEDFSLTPIACYDAGVISEHPELNRGEKPVPGLRGGLVLSARLQRALDATKSAVKDLATGGDNPSFGDTLANLAGNM
jgi:hypothetical protein